MYGAMKNYMFQFLDSSKLENPKRTQIPHVFATKINMFTLINFYANPFLPTPFFQRKEKKRKFKIMFWTSIPQFKNKCTIADIPLLNKVSQSSLKSEINR